MAVKFANLNALKKYLKKIGYTDIKDKDSRSVYVLTNDKKKKVFDTLITQLGGKKNPSTTFGGVMGHIDVGQYRVGVRSLSAQGKKTAGIPNETKLVQAINYVIQEHGEGVCDILFTDGTHKFLCKNATLAKWVGNDTSDRKKADLVIVSSSGGQYPISLKQDNAEYWASVDNYWKEAAVEYLTDMIAKKKVSIKKIQNEKNKITPNIGVEANLQEATDVIFGNDILGHGCVVIKTFDGTEFTFDGKTNCLTITASNVITKLAEVPPDKKVWFIIRNDQQRNSIPGYAGIRALATFKSRINVNMQRINISNR